MDRLLDVSIPTFVINGFLIINSLVLWIQGLLLFCCGVLLYTVLRDFFVDKTGINEVGTFCYYCCCTGIALLAASFFTGHVLFNQSISYFGILAMTYALLLIFQVLFFIAGFYYTDKLQATLRFAVSTTMGNYNANNEINVMLNTLQSIFRCCGSTGYTSWFFTGWAKGKPRVPESCCINLRYCHNLEPVIDSEIHVIGCNSRIDFLAKSMHAGLLGLLLLDVIMAICAIVAAVTMSLRFKRLRELNAVVPIIPNSESSSADATTPSWQHPYPSSKSIGNLAADALRTKRTIFNA
ncbi:tetraspanin-9 isoform X1 [Parasteatoda tepidariorum]|uniref:tetraspanin-9 isoform X1 n=1 Tax=Parasteatoda tepidariorum TaxID=114398 RepID=UPI00077FB77D|nr:tetraspanin-7 isoform X1 [Parasteatoda tepidariorum]